jgi:2-iminobutanoate/2-iminopropanoate deaminase
MTKPKKIECTSAPKAAGPYSQAIAAGGFVYVSGQLPVDLATQKIPDAPIARLTHLAIDHIKEILHSAGLDLADVVKTEVFLKDMADFTEMNRAYGERFCGPVPPARVTIQVARLPMDARIEISCIAKDRS